MTSKEALDKLYRAIDEHLLYDQCGIIFSIDLFNIVEKDLERLEKLSTEIDDLLDDKIELVIKNKQQDMLIGKLIQENEKLKKIIKENFEYEKKYDNIRLKVNEPVEEDLIKEVLK